MVGWLYWQQTRLFQNMNSIVMVIGELARPIVPIAQPEPEVTKQEEVEVEPDVEIDDRVSVEAEDSPKVEIVSGPEPIDTDGLESKTKKELTDMLTKRGIPYSKNDNKTTLVSLLKATA
jgi:hypothetical protein